MYSQTRLVLENSMYCWEYAGESVTLYWSQLHQPSVDFPASKFIVPATICVWTVFIIISFSLFIEMQKIKAFFSWLMHVIRTNSFSSDPWLRSPCSSNVLTVRILLYFELLLDISYLYDEFYSIQIYVMYTMPQECWCPLGSEIVCTFSWTKDQDESIGI